MPEKLKIDTCRISKTTIEYDKEKQRNTVSFNVKAAINSPDIGRLVELSKGWLGITLEVYQAQLGDGDKL